MAKLLPMTLDDPVASLAREVKELAKASLRDGDLRHSEAVRLLGRLPGLCELSAATVQEAETAPERRLLAITQLVREAVDDLAPDHSSPRSAEERTERTQDDYGALRCLLGLVPGSPRTWSSRQERAAAACHQGVNWFRHRRQHDLLYLLARQLISSNEGAPAAAEPPGTCGGVRSPLDSDDGLTVHSDHRRLELSLLEYIQAERPQSARAILLSSVATLPVLTALRDCSCRIQLLLCHRRNTAITDSQRERIETSVSDLRDVHFSEPVDRACLSIYFYKTPPTIRGWQIGRYVGLSWYTYRDHLPFAAEDPHRVWGHWNLLVVGDTSHEQGRMLASWFTQEFDGLRAHRLTEPDEYLYPGSVSSGAVPASDCQPTPV